MARFSHLATSPSRGFRDVLRWRVLDTLAGRRVRDPAGYEYTPPVRVNDGSARRVRRHAVAHLDRPRHLRPPPRRPAHRDRPDLVRRASRASSRAAPRPASRSRASRPSTSSPSATTTTTTSTSRRSRRIGKQALYVTLPGNAPILRDAGLDKVVELDWWQIPPGRRPRRSPRCPPGTGRCARPGIATTCCGAASCFAGPRASPTTRATPRSSTASPRSASAPGPSTGRCCRSAPTSRAGSWSRST